VSENLDLVHSICAPWERGDWTTGAAWADPEVDFQVIGGPEPGQWSGLVAMAEAWQRWLEAWEDYRVESEEYRQLDDERVLVLNRYSGRGKTSGLDVAQTGTSGANVFYLRDGMVTKLVLYWDRDRALADLGLAE
jgi:ketosteroid isomerase-like protein